MIDDAKVLELAGQAGILPGGFCFPKEIEEQQLKRFATLIQQVAQPVESEHPFICICDECCKPVAAEGATPEHPPRVTQSMVDQLKEVTAQLAEIEDHQRELAALRTELAAREAEIAAKDEQALKEQIAFGAEICRGMQLRDALIAERDLRVFGQSEECGQTHWESIRDMRREVYERTDAALATPSPRAHLDAALAGELDDAADEIYGKAFAYHTHDAMGRCREDGLLRAVKILHERAAAIASLSARAEDSLDTERLNWLANNPRMAEIHIDGKMQPCVFYGVSGHPKHKLREMIDAAMAADPVATAQARANKRHHED